MSIIFLVTLKTWNVEGVLQAAFAHIAGLVVFNEATTLIKEYYPNAVLSGLTYSPVMEHEDLSWERIRVKVFIPNFVKWP